MPSSLERSLSRALVYSTHPPVSVCGTGDRGKGLETFLGMTAGDTLRPKPRLSIRLVYHLTSCKFPALTPAGAGIFNLLCIDYALRPHLSSRLTLGGRTWPRKPWVYGDQDSSPGLSLLVSAFSLISAPPSVSVRLRCADYALLPLSPGEPGLNP
jgi:hypothetical protein